MCIAGEIYKAIKNTSEMTQSPCARLKVLSAQKGHFHYQLSLVQIILTCESIDLHITCSSVTVILALLGVQKYHMQCVPHQFIEMFTWNHFKCQEHNDH